MTPEEIRKRILSKFEQGLLPRDPSEKVWGGPSLGSRPCDACDVPIPLRASEVEVECADGKLRFYHPLCFSVLTVERDLLAARSHQPRQSMHTLSDDAEQTPARLRVALDDILDRAVANSRAMGGNIQIYHPRSGGLEIEAQRGFTAEFLERFRVVRPDQPSACARAFRLRQRVVISDVRQDELFTPYLSIAADAGFRAVQSTPIQVGNNVCGVLSTHYPNPTNLDPVSEFELDACAHDAAAAFVRFARPWIESASRV